MNPKNTKKSAIHENADANITCDFGDSDISHLEVGYLTHAIRDTHVASWIIVRYHAEKVTITSGKQITSDNQTANKNAAILA